MIVLRLLALLVAGLALGYGVLVALFWFHQRSLLFHPELARHPPTPPDASFDVPGAVLRGWVVNPGRDRALLYFGGNGEDVSRMRDDAGRLLPHHTVYLVAYRGYGHSSGTPSESALVADALRLFDRVAATHSAVDAMGRSLGSGVAVRLAAARPVARVALITPYDSIDRVAAHHYPWLPIRWLARDRFDSLAQAPRVRADVLVVIAGRDDVIPPSHAERLAAAFPVPPQVLRLPDAQHSNVQVLPAYEAALVGFFGAE